MEWTKRKKLVSELEEGCHQVVLKAVRRILQQGAIDIDSERCKGCGLCVNTCPAHTLRLSDKVNKRGYRHSEQVMESRCIGCGSCALVCPDACISIYRESLTGRKAI